MRGDLLPKDNLIITGISRTETVLGWVLAWKSNDGKCVGRTTPQPKLSQAQAEAESMVEGTGYTLAL